MNFYINNKYVNVKISIALLKYSLQTENLYLNCNLMGIIVIIFFPLAFTWVRCLAGSL